MGLLMLAATGCGQAGAYCAKLIECEDGNDKDEQACVAGFDAEEKQASIYGCDEQWTKYADCIVENSTCVENNGGDKHYSSSDECNTERSNLHDCIDGASTIDDN